MIIENRNTLSFLNSYMGEANSPVTISNSYELIRRFGLPKEENYKKWFMIYNYLKYQDSISVVRPLSTTSINKMLNIHPTVIPVVDDIGDFYNSEVADLSTIVSTDDRSFSVVERYCNSYENIAVIICSTLATWKSSLSSEYVDKVISATTSIPPTEPLDGDTYLLAVTPEVGSVWDGHFGNLAIYDDGTSMWNFVSTIEGGSYYITDEEAEVYKSSGSFIERSGTYNYIDVDDNTYIRKIYNSLQSTNGDIKKCYQLIDKLPDFDNDEFAVFVLRRDSNGLFDMVEKYVVNLDNTSDDYYTKINEESKYIYIKHFTGMSDTVRYSIMESVFKFNTALFDFINVLPVDYEAYIDTVVFNDYDFVLNFEIDNTMSYIPQKCESTYCQCITSIWKTYDTITALIDDFGIYSDDPTGYTSFNRNNINIGNHKKQYDEYNDKNRFIPFSGDLAGLLMSGKDQLIMESTDVIPSMGFEDMTLLKENKINVIEEDFKQKFLFTSELNVIKFKYTVNNLTFNQIAKSIYDIINNNVGMDKPPYERIKDRYYLLIKVYLDSLVDFDISSYEMDVEVDLETHIITITITLNFFGLIETIIVNFQGSEWFTMNYKEIQ